MARELYNWDQNIGYLKIAIVNVLKKHPEIDPKILNELLAEYNTLQTLYGKESIIGLANRIIKQFYNT